MRSTSPAKRSPVSGSFPRRELSQLGGTPGRAPRRYAGRARARAPRVQPRSRAEAEALQAARSPVSLCAASTRSSKASARTSSSSCSTGHGSRPSSAATGSSWSSCFRWRSSSAPRSTTCTGEGYAHLDVKPRNIIMSSTPKLIDLSVALRFEDARRSTTPIGTDEYMAPEQCDPARFGRDRAYDRLVGPRSDAVRGARARAAVPDDAETGPAACYPQLATGAGAARRGRAARSFARSCTLPRGRSGQPASTRRRWSEALEPLAALLPQPRLGRFRPGSRLSRPPAPADERRSHRRPHGRLIGPGYS